MSSKTDFKNPVTQQRLLAALIASQQTQGMTIDYKKIASMMGMTASAVEHRFRGVNAQAKGLRLAHDLHEKGQGPHPSEYDFSAISSNVWGKGGPRAEDLQKYFGGSTEQGLQYHFRALKQQANVLKTAADNGDDPAEAFEEYINDNGHRVKKGVSVKGGSTKAAKAANANKGGDNTKAGPSKKRAAAAPPPKTPHKSPTKKQKVKEEKETSSPGVVDLPEVINSSSPSDVDPPEVDCDALDDKEAPKPEENSPWKKMDIGRPGQWSDLMSGERSNLKAKNEEVLAAHAAKQSAIMIDSSPDTPNEPEGMQNAPGSPSPTPRTTRVKMGGAHPPSTPAFQFDNIDINDDGEGDEEMDDDEDWDDHGAI